ncbi:MAG: sulfate transporter [Pirellula sp.]|nr:sulfate transporter [Pirellula sp.]
MAIVQEGSSPEMTSVTPDVTEAPRSRLPTFGDSIVADITAGFLVFLIALPLCLGIASASGFPPVAGIITAIVGGLLAGFFSNSELTIKGPAAGMIAIVVGAMGDFGYVPLTPGLQSDQVAAITAGNLQAYQYVLAIAVAAGVIQILFGMFKAGVLGEFFPLAPVHGLLASIGLIIIAKQFPLVLGAPAPKGGPLACYAQIPAAFAGINASVATVGLISLAIMFLYPYAKARIKALGKIPAQLIVLIVAIPLGQALHLNEKQLISLPDRIQDVFAFPDYSRIVSSTALKWIIMFSLVGTLESMLSAKAIDLLDPWKRKTSMNRDVLGVGVANTVAALIGGLPMISEILRSSANISNGARTRVSNTAHGLFLLLALLFLVPLVKLIPIAALGAMLVFAGFRLASPKEFVHMWRSGKGQFLAFMLTIGVIMIAGDLLEGIFAGVAAELLLNVFAGASLATLFKPNLELHSERNRVHMKVHSALTFTNWIPFLRTFRRADDGGRKDFVVDLTNAHPIDRTARDKLAMLQSEFAGEGRELELVGFTAADHHG